VGPGYTPLRLQRPFSVNANLMLPFLLSANWVDVVLCVASDVSARVRVCVSSYTLPVCRIPLEELPMRHVRCVALHP